VYRSDIEYDFDLKPAAFQQLIDNIDRDLAFAIEVEAGKDRKDVVNYDEVCHVFVCLFGLHSFVCLLLYGGCCVYIYASWYLLDP
jgi:hypothetical protein